MDSSLWQGKGGVGKVEAGGKQQKMHMSVHRDLDREARGGEGEKQINWKYILKVEPTELAGQLDVGVRNK